MTSSDAEELFRAVQDNSSFLLPWVTTPLRIRDIDSARIHVATKLSNGMPARHGAFDEGRLLGSVRLIEAVPQATEYEIGIWRVRDACPHGLAKWMLGRAICAAFGYGASRVIVQHAVSNSRAALMIGGFGIRFVGVDRRAVPLGDGVDDAAVYAILVDEMTLDRYNEWGAEWHESC